MLCADPPAVTVLQVERINASQITVSWELKSNDTPVTSYTIKYYPLIPDIYMQESLVRYLTTNETEVMVQYLDPNFSYSISVAANNGIGRGNYTDEIIVECKCHTEHCSVILEDDKPAFCKTFPEPDKSTSSPFLQGTSTPTKESSYPVVTYAAFATAIVVVLALALVLVCIVTMAVWRKKTHSRHLRYTYTVYYNTCIFYLIISTRLSQDKPLSATNMQALEKSHVGEKHASNIHDSSDGIDLYETKLYYYSVPPPSFQNPTPKPPAASININHYETIHELSEDNTSLPHTDFNQELPSLYATTGSQQASVNSPSQYQKLMVRSETHTYTSLQVVHQSDKSTTHGQCESAVSVNKASYSKNETEGDGTVNNYAALLAATKEDENEYASLTIHS